jgi:hypothetical protein
MNLKTEYERDFDAWLYQHVQLLKQGRLAELDVEHLIEELEDLSKDRKSERVSRFIVLIAHLLKWQFQFRQLATQWQEFEGKSWRKTIIEQRLQIGYKLEDNPSFKRYLPEAVAKAYPKAVAYAVEETGMNPSLFPVECPFTLSQLLDKSFYPESH